MEGKKLFDYEKEDTLESKDKDEKNGKIVLKILQIVIGAIMALFHI
ncbi:hypothetical protein [Chryseobacterium sp.]|nr:hypothetical protein [Chryseobacterium sp.]